MAGHCSIFCDVFWDLVCVDLIDLINTWNTWNYKINMLQLGWNCRYFHQSVEEMQSSMCCLSWGGDFEGVKVCNMIFLPRTWDIFPTLQDEFAFRGSSMSGSYLCAAEKLLNPGIIFLESRYYFWKWIEKKCYRPIYW